MHIKKIWLLSFIQPFITNTNNTLYTEKDLKKDAETRYLEKPDIKRSKGWNIRFVQNLVKSFHFLVTYLLLPIAFEIN